ncbi:MAG: cytochrome c [Deltaproteobacteria bacterium]|nr:cytochrome c [Deltaproteobacteria bacterium]
MVRQVGWVLGAALCSLVAAGPSAGADPTAGKALHDASCLKCHGTEVYTSAQRKSGSLDALTAQVARCTKAAEVTWTEAQVADVAAYLNEAFYHFK